MAIRILPMMLRLLLLGFLFSGVVATGLVTGGGAVLAAGGGSGGGPGGGHGGAGTGEDSKYSTPEP